MASPLEEVSGRGLTYFGVWEWLVALLVLGLAVFVLPISRTAAALLVLGFALVKAGLVVRNYMHLKREHVLLYFLVAVPVTLVLILLVALVPDIAQGH